MIPYPVGPTDAGSTPSTRKQSFLMAEFEAGLAAFIELSLRRSPTPCQSFVGEFLGKRKTANPIRGMAVTKRDRHSCPSLAIANQFAPTAACISDSSISKFA